MGQKWSERFIENPFIKIQPDDIVAIARGATSGAGKWGALTNMGTAKFVNAAIGDDTNGNGSFLSPWATLGGALAAITDNSVSNIYTIHVFGNIAEVSASTVNFKPYINIFGDGSIWSPVNVGIDSSFNSVNGALIWIQNLTLNPTGTWNVAFSDASEHFNAIGLKNCTTIQTVDSAVTTPPATFSWGSPRGNDHFYFIDCDFAEFNNGGETTFNFNDSGLIYFEGGTAPSYLFGLNTSNSAGISYIYLNRVNLYTNETNFYFNEWDIYITNTSPIFNGSGQVFNLLNNCGVYYDTSAYEPSQYFVNGMSPTSYTINDHGSDYTHATVTYSAPDMTHGVTQTATAGILGGEILSLTLTNTGTGYLNPPTITIVGDGTGASYTSILSSSNSFNAQVTDQAILGTYSPFNYNIPTPLLGNAAIYDQLAGIDIQLGYFGGLINGSATLPTASATAPPSPIIYFLNVNSSTIVLPAIVKYGQVIEFVVTEYMGNPSIVTATGQSITGNVLTGYTAGAVNGSYTSVTTPALTLVDNTKIGQYIKLAGGIPGATGVWFVLENFGWQNLG